MQTDVFHENCPILCVVFGKDFYRLIVKMAGGCFALVLPDAVVSKCQTLRHEEQLKLQAQTCKEGAGIKENVSVYIQRNNKCLVVSLYASSMGSMLNRPLSDSWQCSIFESQNFNEHVNGVDGSEIPMPVDWPKPIKVEHEESSDCVMELTENDEHFQNKTKPHELTDFDTVSKDGISGNQQDVSDSDSDSNQVSNDKDTNRINQGQSESRAAAVCGVHPNSLLKDYTDYGKLCQFCGDVQKNVRKHERSCPGNPDQLVYCQHGKYCPRSFTLIKKSQLAAHDKEFHSKVEEKEESSDECSPAKQKRHKDGNGDNCKISKAHSAATVFQTKWAVKLFKGWLEEYGYDSEFERISIRDLDELLCQFYSHIKPRGMKTDYSRSGYMQIRGGLNRHLKHPPFSRQISLKRDPEFENSNLIFMEILDNLKSMGTGKPEITPIISSEDIGKMYSSDTLGNSTPWGVLYKVYFEFCLYFAHCGREELRKIKKDSFIFKTDENGLEYACMASFDKFGQKKLQRYNNKEKFSFLPSLNNNPLCPIKSLKRLLEVLNPECDALFQHPKRIWEPDDECWFENRPVGKNNLGRFMSAISRRAELSQNYNSSSIRETSLHILGNTVLENPSVSCITEHFQSYIGATNCGEEDIVDDS